MQNFFPLKFEVCISGQPFRTWSNKLLGTRRGWGCGWGWRRGKDAKSHLSDERLALGFSGVHKSCERSTITSE